jgi:hypothetical protein
MNIDNLLNVSFVFIWQTSQSFETMKTSDMININNTDYIENLKKLYSRSSFVYRI